MSLDSEIKTYIHHHGYLSIAQYMKMVLTHDEYGYYRKHDPLGKSGDFITAPEISQIFGELIGMWLATQFSEMGEPKDCILVELGAGRGTLISDILRATAKIPKFHSNIKIHIIECNDELKALQKTAIAPYDIKTHWHNDVSTLPKKPLLLVANEFFDALPTHQFVRTDQGWRERMITVDQDDNLTFGLTQSPTPQCAFAPKDWQELPTDCVYEFCPEAHDIVYQLSQHIREHRGAGITIDYGYYDNLFTNSFQAVKDHAFHDPLMEPGSADLTTHVNFKRLANTALSAGATAYIGLTQGDFLDQMGIHLRAQMLKKNASPLQAEKISQDVERLTSPEQMGSLFKTMAITHPDLPTPYPFGHRPC